MTTVLSSPTTEALVLAIAARVLHRHPWAPEPQITPATEITCDVDRAGIACGIEEEIMARELPEQVWRAWQTVGDVLACVAEWEAAEA